MVLVRGETLATDIRAAEGDCKKAWAQYTWLGSPFFPSLPPLLCGTNNGESTTMYLLMRVLWLRLRPRSRSRPFREVGVDGVSAVAVEVAAAVVAVVVVVVSRRGCMPLKGDLLQSTTTRLVVLPSTRLNH